MTASLTFYTNPMSRGQIVRWMLEEVGAPYDQVLLDFSSGMKDAAYLAINPMGKVPAIKHGEHVVTECAAICAYLADAFPEAGLAPALSERADYYRWLFFAAGPLEQALVNTSLGFEVPAEKTGMAGYGNFALTVDVLELAVSNYDYVAGPKFSAADVYVGSQIVCFGTLPKRPAFEAYAARVTARPAYIRANEIDGALIAQAQQNKA